MGDEDEKSAANDLLTAAEEMNRIASEAIEGSPISHESILAMRLVEIASKFKTIAEECLSDALKGRTWH